MTIIALIGPPASGKSRQSCLLSEKLGFRRFAAGEMYRIEAQSDPVLHRLLQVDPLLTSSEADPYAKLLYKWLGEFVDKHKTSPIILDGTPRSVSYAEGVEDLLQSRNLCIDLLIALEVSGDVLLPRMQARGRNDDTAERSSLLYREAKKLGELYQWEGCYHPIDASGKPSEVFANIKAALWERNLYPSMSGAQAASTLEYY